MGNPAFDYDSLIKPLEPRMMRTIWRILREKPAAEDALQDALAVIWKKRGTVARHPNPPALILRITIASAVDSLRKTRRRLRHEVPGLPKDRRADDSADRAAGKAEERRFRPAILQAVGRLPKRQAEAVLLRIIEELSYEEIARAMGCTEATARVHVMRGKAALARRLARFRPDPARQPGLKE
ncbi:MAG TPA: RNA polymerase sigma factor [Candidatus Aminicenantes bacterium]|nr:RNA polymerase sigma factor [Candidatus Aminicenantes bacterium]HOS11827.1 RNA polymerase sigma factor [Candidatus Aminicenantes bacterium]HPL14250.1 RNA polymerase sigma factor [Candidatus Aminicenantes bacterium]